MRPCRRRRQSPALGPVIDGRLLASLVTGLVVFLVWLPSAPRAALFAALLAQRALMGMLFLFALIALSLLWSAGQRLDSWVFRLFNLRGYHPQWLDRVIWLATQVGNMVTAFLLAGLFFVLNYRSLAVEVIFGTLTLWLLVETIKALTDRARPFLALEGTRVIGLRERRPVLSQRSHRPDIFPGDAV